MMQDTTEIPEKGSFLNYLYFLGRSFSRQVSDVVSVVVRYKEIFA